MEPRPKKLTLNRQTLRSLDAAQLARVVGGAAQGTNAGPYGQSALCVMSGDACMVTNDAADCSLDAGNAQAAYAPGDLWGQQGFG